MGTTLLDKTLALLNQDKGNWPTTARETGLNREWLAKLAQGHINDPGVVKIQKLHSYLSEKYAKAA